MNKNLIEKKQSEVGKVSNVTSIEREERSEYGRSYVMTESKKRVWVENHMPDEANKLLYAQSKSKLPKNPAAEKNEQKARLLIFSVCIMAVLMVFAGIIAYFGSRLVVKEVRVEGSELFSADMLLSSSGLNIDDKLPFFTADTIANNLLSEYPYIKECSVKVELPNTVIFNITDDEATVYAEIFGDYYAMNSSLKILERSEYPESFSHLLKVELPSVKRAVVGGEIELANELDSDYIVAFLGLVEQSKLAGRLDIVYFDEKYDIVASVDGKFRVLFGSPSNMSLKIKASAHIIEQNIDKCTSGSVVDVRVVDVAGIVINAGIDPAERE